jgi:hypothetical protein
MAALHKWQFLHAAAFPLCPSDCYCMCGGAQSSREGIVKLGPFAKPTIFAIGQTRAFSAVCQGSEFVAAKRFDEDPPRTLACTSCGARYPTDILMQQVVRKVIERADVALRHAEYLEGHLVAAATYIDILLERLGEAERLLRSAGEGDRGRAVALLNEIALDGPTFAVRIGAFSALALASAMPGGLPEGELSSVLVRIREGLEEAKNRQREPGDNPPE